MTKKNIQSDDRIGLILTQAERSLLLAGLTLLPSAYEDAVTGTPAKEPVMLTLDALDELGGYIATEANHTQDKKKATKLDAIFQRIQKLLGTLTDDEPPRTISFDDSMKSKALTDNAVQVAEFAATALMAAESMGIKTKPLEHFYLSPAQREVLLAVPDISTSIKTTLTKDNASFTVDGFDDSNCVDSTRTRISKILPKTGNRFSFTYEYDFGDGWDHEILFEGCPQKEPRKKYPLCVEGERACPPEDVGGIGGFYEFLEALADPEHDQHDDLMEWAGEFEPEKFDARQATREMKEVKQ